MNRFSGIRSPARDFYWAVENGEVDGCSVRFFTPEEMQGGPDIPPSGPFADETLSSASLIVTATGYRTNVPPVCVQLPNGRFFPLEWCINRPFDQQIRVSNDSLQCAVWHPQQPNNPTFLARVYGIGLGYGITGAANERKDGVNVRSDGFWICRAARLANPKRHRYLGTCVAVLSHVGGGEASERPAGE